MRRLRVGLLLVTGLALLPAPVAAQTETVEYYALDAIGSARVVFDANGAVVSRLDFGPFGGQLFPATGAPKNKFAGLFRDEESGLDYAQARMYESRTGRFTRPDPVYAGLFQPQRWNRYAYALNSPLQFVDPSGLLASSEMFCTTTSSFNGEKYSSNTTCDEGLQAFAGGYGWTPGGAGWGGISGGYGYYEPQGGRGQVPKPTPPQAPPIVPVPPSAPPVPPSAPPVPPTPPKLDPPKAEPPKAAPKPPRSLLWGACFALGNAILDIPVVAGITVGCAGTAIGYPACVLAAAHAAEVPLTLHMGVVAGVCTAVTSGR